MRRRVQLSVLQLWWNQSTYNVALWRIINNTVQKTLCMINAKYSKNGWNSEYYDRSDQIADFLLAYTDQEEYMQHQQLTYITWLWHMHACEIAIADTEFFNLSIPNNRKNEHSPRVVHSTPLVVKNFANTLNLRSHFQNNYNYSARIT